MTATSRLGNATLRATIIGTSRSVDAALPTDVPIALLLDSICQLLEEPPGTTTFRLSTTLGKGLDPSTSLGESDLKDGCMLRLIRVDETPVDPLVFDLADVSREVRPAHEWTSETSTLGEAYRGTATLAAMAIMVWFLWRPSSVLMIAGGVATLACGVLLSLLARSRRASILVAALGTTVALAGTLSYRGPSAARPYVFVGVAALVLLGVGMIRRTWRSLLPALLLCGLLSLGWAALGAAHLGSTQRAAVAMVCCLSAVGLVPQLALHIHGAFKLDGKISREQSVARRTASDALLAAHSTLELFTLLLALGFGLSAGALAQTAHLNGWGAAVLIVGVSAWLLRGRLLPLISERVAVWIAALSPAVMATLTPSAHQELLGSILLGLFTLVALAMLTGRVQALDPYTLAHIRKLLGSIEALLMFLLVPLLLGTFGIYTTLLRTF